MLHLSSSTLPYSSHLLSSQYVERHFSRDGPTQHSNVSAFVGIMVLGALGVGGAPGQELPLTCPRWLNPNSAWFGDS